jgi:hypothetical protein
VAVRTVQDIVFGVAGQVLVCDAPEGRPTSVGPVTVFRWDSSDLDVAELAIAGAASVEANPVTTTDAAAGAGQVNPRRVPLTVTTGCTPRRVFQLVGADLLKEWIDVEQVLAGDAVIAAHPLHNDYAIGSTFVSTRMTATIDTTWCGELTNIDPSAGTNPMFRARWVYVVAGVTCVADTYFNLVRYAGRHGVRPQDVELTLAGWLNTLPSDHRKDQGRRIIDEAYRAVKLDLHQVLVDDSAIAESEVVDELVRYKTIELTEWARFMASSSSTADETRHLSAEKKYATRLNAFVRVTTKVPIRNGDGKGAPGKAIGLTRR